MRTRRFITGFCALLMCLGCDDAGDGGSTGRPTLRLGGTTQCGRIILPVATRDEITSGNYRSLAVTVRGNDPGVSSMEIANGTEVSLTQIPTDDATPQVLVFNSSFETARMQANILEAVQAANQSAGVRFVGGDAVDRVFCLFPGTVTITGRIASYTSPSGFAGEVVTPTSGELRVQCVSASAYEDICGNPPPPDAGPVDMGVAEDGGEPADMGQADGETPPALWSVRSIPAMDPNDLIIGIRNSGLGRQDNVGLDFKVSELQQPLEGVLVKFILDEITQPGVTISAGAAALSTSNGGVVVRTNAEGVASVRLVAGGTPGLAGVRAVALRPDPGDLRNCAANDYDCLFEAYCGRNLGNVDRAEQCEQDRSSTVTIIAGIPSGRGIQDVCEDTIIPAFTVREGSNWLLANEPGTECTLQLADRVNGRISAGTQVFFLTEAGTVNENAAVDEDGRAITHLRVGRPAPDDVDALPYEQAAGFARRGYNPRDGLVRMVAVARGEEDFADVDGDKIFDPNAGDFLEPGMDLPEPFIDANDNGTWDEGEEYRDANNNNVWDDVNDRWDTSTEIWDSTTVLWTGDLFSCWSPFTGEYLGLPDCGCTHPVTGEDLGLDDCADNVAPDRNVPIIEFSCGQGCSAANPYNELCPPGAFYFDPGAGGQLQVTGRFFDINGNCLGGRGEGSFEVRQNPTLLARGQSAGNIAGRYCFQASERPLGQPLSVTLIDIAPLNLMMANVSTVEVVVRYLGVGGEDHESTFRTTVCR
ncbi:MAG: hypothetical protein R3F60_21940 [bacterium]